MSRERAKTFVDRLPPVPAVVEDDLSQLPDEMVDREKQGFGLPIAAWLRGPLREWSEDLLADTGEPFDRAQVRDLWRRHLAGEEHQGDLWTVLMYEAWKRG